MLESSVETRWNIEIVINVKDQQEMTTYYVYRDGNKDMIQ